MKEVTLRREEQFLCDKAFFSKNTAGRLFPVDPCPVRTEFQRDRDRITHCKSFRRLMHKMQVFLAPEGDHYRTRLTHTLEVTQIARTLARALCLNEDLAEAGALGHDLGHTPFGHSGERALDEICDGGFRHYEQSLRVVDKLEKNGEGLNLTHEVRDAIVNHSGSGKPSTFEGKLLLYADRIAYINHDIDDACRAGILRREEIPNELREVLGDSHGQRIDTMVNAVIDASADRNEIGMTPAVLDATNILRAFLFENVYTNPRAKAEEQKAKEMLALLFSHFVKHPE